jgi:hypothetical protein
MLTKAPIAFFAYKRPEHTRRALESLSQNHGADQSELFIFCEAPKRLEDQQSVQAVRDVARSKQWCGNVHIIERRKNLGCANSIITGITEICEKYSRVIVVEDDLVLSPFFLNYMNQALELYENDSQVMQVSGYMFPLKLDTDDETVFLPLAAAWGWATWKRAWSQFDPLMTDYAKLKADKALRHKFDFNGSHYFFSMLEAQLNGKIDAWDICFYLNIFFAGGLVLYPAHSLVRNIGFDGSGTHYQKKKSSTTEVVTDIYNSEIHLLPKPLLEDQESVETLSNYFRILHQNKPPLLKRIIAKLSPA